jgi:hypothetical protein
VGPSGRSSLDFRLFRRDSFGSSSRHASGCDTIIECGSASRAFPVRGAKKDAAGRFSFSSGGSTSAMAGLASAVVSVERLARIAAAPAGTLCPLVKNGCNVVGGIAFRAAVELARAMEGRDNPGDAGLAGHSECFKHIQIRQRSERIVD